VEEMVHTIIDRVAKLEAGPPMTMQEMSRILDAKVARIEKAIAQTSQNNSIRALHDKITTLEASLRHHKEKSTKYEEHYGKMDAW
jgi:hypothetical protein